MRNILVPTDFSEPAREALLYAVALANRFDAKITLLHAYRHYAPTGSLVSITRHIEADAERDFEALEHSVQPLLHGQASISHQLQEGDAAAVIAQAAAKGKHDLIVMGTQGASGLGEIFLGSVANSVIKSTETPVLVIPAGAPFRPIQRIALAIDQRAVSHTSVVRSLIDVAKSNNAFTYIYHQDTGIQDDGIDSSISAALLPLEYSIHYDLTESDSINESINRFLKEYRIDLLCMIRRRRSLVERLFHTSITTREVFNSPIPLLILHDVA